VEYRDTYKTRCNNCGYTFLVSGYVPNRVQCDKCYNGFEPVEYVRKESLLKRLINKLPKRKDV